MYTLTNARREVRRKAAEARQAERDKRSPEEQLARLDAMHGEGKGATKERLRLHEQIKREKIEAKKAEKCI